MRDRARSARCRPCCGACARAGIRAEFGLALTGAGYIRQRKSSGASSRQIHDDLRRRIGAPTTAPDGTRNLAPVGERSLEARPIATVNDGHFVAKLREVPEAVEVPMTAPRTRTHGHRLTRVILCGSMRPRLHADLLGSSGRPAPASPRATSCRSCRSGPTSSDGCVLRSQGSCAGHLRSGGRPTRLAPKPGTPGAHHIMDGDARLSREGLVPGWRKAVSIALLRRAGAHARRARRHAPFGMTAYGAHLNGFWRRAANTRDARRSASKQVDPGKLDNASAGASRRNERGRDAAQEAWEAGISRLLQASIASAPYASVFVPRDCREILFVRPVACGDFAREPGRRSLADTVCLSRT